MPGRPSTARGRVGLVSMRFTLFDAQMPPDFRVRQEQAVARLAALLGQEFEVVETGLLQSDEEARRANELLRSSGLDAVVLAPAMAAPPSHGALATEGLEAPLVLWNAPLVERLGPDLDQASAHEETTLV